MSKIAIITLNGYFNYGNRLQNYALQEAIESLGHEVETIRFNRSNLKNEIRKKIGNIKRFTLHPRVFNSENERKKIFKYFTTQNIKETERTYNIHDDLGFLNKKHDYFVIGSDQVWNPSMNKRSSAFFAEFADKSKRISYSPSFGISSISDEDKYDYKKWLNEIAYISTREDDGARIIMELTGREAEVLIDPTLLLSKKEWLTVSKNAPIKTKKPFLLTYFLGEIPSEYQQQIDLIAMKHNLEIINLADQKDKKTYETGPGEFIDYINKATIFCTDSFHGTVFSIILEKPFIVYERRGSVSMFSRINTLLDIFDLHSRKSGNINLEENNALNINYSNISEVLKYEKNKSMNFLVKALS